MGTSAEKLNRLKTTKDEIREAINNKGGTLTESDKFSDYATAIDNLQSGDVLKEILDITKSSYKLFIGSTGYVTDLGYSGEDDTVYSKIDYNYYSFNNLLKFDTTSNVTNMACMFYKMYKIKSVPLFDTSNVTNMKSMFYECMNIIEIPLFNTSNVTDMGSMFYSCGGLTEVPAFDTSNVTDMRYMLYNCNSLRKAPLFNTSKVTNMSGMFGCGWYRGMVRGNEYITELPLYDTSNVTNMSYAFSGLRKIKTVPLFDTSNVTDMNHMFGDGQSSTDRLLERVPLFNTSKVTNMGYMFTYCKHLTEVPAFDTSKVTDMRYMFEYCRSLTKVPTFDTSNVRVMGCMFQGCESLIEVPTFDTSNVTDMNYMLYNCKSLKKVTLLDLIKAPSTSRMFYGCSKLEYLNLLNVKVNIQIGSGSEWGHLIQKDCLIQIISELIKPESGTKTLTMGSANIAKLADTYVKLLEDDGTGKYPFELCESTDEGAMLIRDYCTAKSWNLA